jgi:hypothetical protein
MYQKYQRTLHAPWSPGATSDDRIHENMNMFVDREVIVPVKLDGENTNLYRDHMHARSLDTGYHPSRDWIRTFHGNMAHTIPHGMRICGENMYAKHSIHYQNLKTYFYVFSIWDENNRALSWDDTLMWCELLELTPVPVLYRGTYSEYVLRHIYDWATGTASTKACAMPELRDEIRAKYVAEMGDDILEGWVMRLTDGFGYDDFATSLAKFVRPNHVQSDDEHWTKGAIVPNGLIG